MSPLRQLFYVTAAVVWTLLLFSGRVRSSYCWDKQTETYEEQFKPADCTDLCTVTPFFSPDTSINTYVNLIESAKKSIDIYTPSKCVLKLKNSLHHNNIMSHLRTMIYNTTGLKSWNSNCTRNTDCPKRGSCTGCPLEQQKKEPFPVFPALLNAIHERGVQVRIVTNNFTFYACEGVTIPLDWFVLNKIQVRFYTTTTFLHAKFIVIDKGVKTAVSSVNWSYTSFMRNREAGVIIEDCTCSAISFYQSVFDYDWDHGLDYILTRTYSKAEMDYIRDTAHMPYTIPNGSIPGTFVTQLIPHTNVAIKKTYASPDYARDTIMSYMGSIKKSLNVSNDCGLVKKIPSSFNEFLNKPKHESKTSSESFPNITHVPKTIMF